MVVTTRRPLKALVAWFLRHRVRLERRCPFGETLGDRQSNITVCFSRPSPPPSQRHRGEGNSRVAALGR